jgi:hypothetical protein
MLTPKQHATIIQKRCAITIGATGKTSSRVDLSKRGEIRVSAIEQYTIGEADYYFDIFEEDVFEFRGRMRREPVWSARITVSKKDVSIYEETDLDPVPHGVLDCVKQAIAESERELLKP